MTTSNDGGEGSNATDLSFADRQLLGDVKACRVADDPDTMAALIDLGPDEPADVTGEIAEFKRRGWVHDGEWPAWRLTQRGEDVLAGRVVP